MTEPHRTVDDHHEHEPARSERPGWWAPHLLFSIAAVAMTAAVVLLVILGLARGAESELEHARDECEALHDGAVYEAGAASRRTIHILLVEIANQQLTGTYNAARLADIAVTSNTAFAIERLALDAREAFLAAGRPVPCTIEHTPIGATTPPGPLPTVGRPTTTRPATTTTAPPRTTTAATTTTIAAAVTTLAVIRPSTTTRPPTPIPTPTTPRPTTPPATSTSSTTTTTIDCPGNSNNCNRPHGRP